MGARGLDEQTERTDGRWVRRHPILVLLAVNGALFALLAIIAEIFLRFWVPYNPGYYVAVRGSSQEVEYPYGTIKINRAGYADIDWELGPAPRIGYIGDSVTYGVGAGYGYRFTDLLRASLPEYSHLNFSGIGLTVSQDTIEWATKLAQEYELDTVVYFMNLNDIVPDASAAPRDPGRPVVEVPWTRRAQGWILGNVDRLRGKSYLYTWMRTEVKNRLEARGVGFHGYQAYELAPNASRDIFVETVDRVLELEKALAERGVEFIVVLLPYEMQISEEAARVYRGHGINWEPGFLEGSAQRLLIELLSADVRVIDLMPAFVDPERRAQSRAENGVGQLFVYDRGDKLDWNHPNREGHRRIAEYLLRIDFLGRSQAPVSRPSIAASSPVE